MSKLTVYEEHLNTDWVDANGHLNEGYYLVPFANANWHCCNLLDVGEAYTQRTGCAFYTVESHLCYLQEIQAPALLRVTPIVLSVDEKRWHGGAVMMVDGVERATFETVAVHVDIRAGRTAPMPDDVRAKLRSNLAHQEPAWVGRRISLGRQ